MCHLFIRHIWFTNWAVNWHIKANCMCQIRQIFLTHSHMMHHEYTYHASCGPSLRETRRGERDVFAWPSPFSNQHNCVMLCTKAAMCVFWKICCRCLFTFSSQIYTVYSLIFLIFSRVTMEEDFDIEME